MQKHIPLAALVTVCLMGLMLPLLQAAYLESDVQQPPDSPRPTGRLPPPNLPPDRSPSPQPVLELLRQVEVGAPYRHRDLLLYPLYTRDLHTSERPLTLQEALNRNLLSIQECPEVRVPALCLQNHAGQPVFLLGGQIVAGGKQNRILRDDALLPARSGLIEISVFCGEQRRWQPDPIVFHAPGLVAHPALRKAASSAGSQDAAWAEIDRSLSHAEAKAPTRDYTRLYEAEATQRDTAECLRGFTRILRPDAVGVAVVRGHSLLGADLFGNPSLFSALREDILRAYSVSAAETDTTRKRDLLPDSDVQRILARARDARFSDAPTPGAGILWTLSGAADGAALTWNHEVIHLLIHGTSAYETRSTEK